MHKLIKIYAVQPYLVGPKDNKSLALIIPAKVAREYGVNTSTIFTTNVDENSNTLSLQMIKTTSENNTTPTGKSLAASSQQVIRGAQL
jgi:hypothetical protein